MNKNNISDKSFFRVSSVYWILHGFILLYLPGIGNFSKAIAILLLTSSLIIWIFLKKIYIKIYAALMFLYSIVYTIMAWVICLLFSPESLLLLALLLVGCLNYLLSIVMYRKSMKFS